MGQSVPASANEIFHQYLAAEEPAHDPEDLLARLTVEFAQPLMERVIRRRLSTRHGVNLEDVEDVSSEALASLVMRLRAIRANPRTVDVADFEAYAVGLASHVAFQFFAARSPERSRLRSRLRYLLTIDSRFRIWRIDHGVLLCAPARSGSPALVVPAPAIEECRRALTSRSLPSSLPDLVMMVLAELGGAIEIGDLTTLTAALLGVQDRTDGGGNLDETLADPGAAHSLKVELRDSLRVLWNEIKELPIVQRTALLLNLRSTAGAGVWLFTDLGIVTFRDLASCLGLSTEELAALWNRLPLGDNEIAASWGLERQQVINMRSAARQRLVRRTKSGERNASGGNIGGVSSTD